MVDVDFSPRIASSRTLVVRRGRKEGRHVSIPPPLLMYRTPGDLPQAPAQEAESTIVATIYGHDLWI